jgi:hypothetical protein
LFYQTKIVNNLKFSVVWLAIYQQLINHDTPI